MIDWHMFHNLARWRFLTRAKRLSRAGGRRRVSVVLGLALGVLALPVAAQLYRWVDDDGKVHFSDRLPPEATGKARVELSDDGTPVREVEAAKTREEWLREQEIERVRRETQALVDKQRRADEILLRSYRSVDDLLMMRDGKIAAIDVMIQQIKGNIRRLQNRINRLQADAADRERAGKPIPPSTEEDIAATKESIEGDLAQILRHERAKQEIFETFAKDLDRFRRLQDVREPVTPETNVQILLGLQNLVPCADKRECDLLWGQAVGYVETHSTEPVESMSNHVVITAAPDDDEDISLIVSRIPNDPKNPNAGAVLFLDLQCRSYTQSASSCRTPARIEVLEGFRVALLGDRADEPDPPPVPDTSGQSAPDGEFDIDIPPAGEAVHAD